MERLRFKEGDLVVSNGKYFNGKDNSVHNGNGNTIYKVVRSYHSPAYKHTEDTIDVLINDTIFKGWLADGFDLAEDAILKEIWK